MLGHWAELRDDEAIVVRLYNRLGRGTSRVYEQDLEQRILSQHAQTRASSKAWLKSESLCDYLCRTETRLDDESRAEAYLRPATHAKVQRVCDDELLGDAKVQTVMLQRADGAAEGNLD